MGQLLRLPPTPRRHRVPEQFGWATVEPERPCVQNGTLCWICSRIRDLSQDFVRPAEAARSGAAQESGPQQPVDLRASFRSGQSCDGS
jgi:hypothetical protein